MIALRFVAGFGLWTVVSFGIVLAIRFSEASSWQRFILLAIILIGSVLFTVFHDAKGA